MDDNYNILMVFAIHQYESAIGIHVSPPSWTSWTTPRTSLPTSSLWVVTEHQLWVPCFMHQTCTGHLFYIWSCTCYTAILSNHPTLTFFCRVEKCVLYISVSFASSQKEKGTGRREQTISLKLHEHLLHRWILSNIQKRFNTSPFQPL